MISVAMLTILEFILTVVELWLAFWFYQTVIISLMFTFLLYSLH